MTITRKKNGGHEFKTCGVLIRKVERSGSTNRSKQSRSPTSRPSGMRAVREHSSHGRATRKLSPHEKTSFRTNQVGNIPKRLTILWNFDYD